MDESTARSRHPDSLGQAFLWALLPSLVLFLIAPPAVSLAQVVTNITPTTIAPLDLGTNVDTVGSTTEITGGTRPGSGTNLFHSFDYFTLGTGDIAHFMNDMMLPTTNIIARVIGGEVKEASTIDGTLRTNNPLDATDPMNFGAANLWLVNPSGVFLGPNARVEVGGSVSMSTANYLRFEGTPALFDMLSTPASLGLLDVAPVVAFGFTGPAPPAPITVQGSILQVPEGQTLSLVGGDITVQAGTLGDGTIQAASLRAPGGQLNLVSVASPGEVLAPSFQTGPNIDGASFNMMGTVSITEGATLDVSGQLDEFGTPIGNGNSGTVFVRGGQLVMDASFIQGNTLSSVDGAPIAVDVQVSQDVTLTNGAGISVATSGAGRAGDVQLTAEGLGLDGAALIKTETFADGNAGHLTANVGTLSLANGATISSNNFSFGTDLNGDGVADVFGVGGNVTVQGLQGPGSAADSVALTNGAGITTQTFGPGRGGDVQSTAGTIGLDGAGTAITTWTFGDGNGGNITADVGTLSVTNGAMISSFTFAFGQGGNVTVQGLQGPGSAADSVALTNVAGITTQTFGPGRGGDVQITAGTIGLDGALDGAVTAISTGTFGDGIGGNVTANVGTLSVTNGAMISSNDLSFGLGQGGNVTVQGLQGPGYAADSVTLSNTNGPAISTVTAFGLGRGGDVSITADTLLIENASFITTDTILGGGGGGNLSLNVGTLTLKGGPLGRSKIRTNNDTFGTDLDFDGVVDETAAGGNVTIQGIKGAESAANLVVLSGGSEILSETLNNGNGGRVSIAATSLNLLDEASTISSNTFGFGLGGDIVVSVQQTSLSGGATIASRTVLIDPAAGAGGRVTVQGLDGDGSKADSLNFAGFRSGIISEAFGSGSPGDIEVHAKTVSLTDGGVIEGGNPQSTGTGGDVIIDANSVGIAGGSHIKGQAFAQDAGQVTITADQLTLDNGSIDTTTGSETGGRGGDVVLNVGSVSLANGATITSSTSRTGRGGDIMMNVGTLTLTKNAEISSNSKATASGNAGIVTIQGPGGAGTSATSVTLTNSSLLTNAEGAGAGGDISVAAGSLTLNNASTVSAATAGPQNAGTITISTIGNPVSLAGGSRITSSTTGDGNAGQVIVTTPTLSLDNASLATSTSSSGNAGSIRANVDTLSLTGGAQITSASTGTASGSAGSVAIQGLASPADAVTLTNSSLLTSADSMGRGGSIAVDATNLTLTNATISASVKDVNAADGTDGPTSGIGNIALTSSTMNMTGSTVTTESSGARNAGDIKINPDVAGNSFEMQNSTINTSAALADGGNIGIYATNMVRLTDSIITSSVGNETKTDTLGGNVTIDPQFVILQNSQIRANAFAGAGGAIDIIATSAFIKDPASIVSASSTLGISGTVNIQSPLQNVGGRLTPLSQQFASAAALLAQQCAARVADGKFSTFVVAGREGLPVEPGGFLASPSLTAELFGSSLSGRYPHSQYPAVTGLFPEYDARPIQLAKFVNACR